jgi:hypothetical protein
MLKDSPNPLIPAEMQRVTHKHIKGGGFSRTKNPKPERELQIPTTKKPPSREPGTSLERGT